MKKRGRVPRARREAPKQQPAPEKLDIKADPAMNGLFEVMKIKEVLRKNLEHMGAHVHVMPEYDRKAGEWVLMVRGIKCPLDDFAGYKVVNVPVNAPTGLLGR